MGLVDKLTIYDDPISKLAMIIVQDKSKLADDEENRQ